MSSTVTSVEGWARAHQVMREFALPEVTRFRIPACRPLVPDSEMGLRSWRSLRRLLIAQKFREVVAELYFDKN